MRLFAPFRVLAFYLLLPKLLATPATKADTQALTTTTGSTSRAESSSASTPASTQASSESHSNSTATLAHNSTSKARPHATSAATHSFPNIITTRSAPHVNPFTHSFNPIHTHLPQISPSAIPSHSSHHQAPIAIVFEVLGGLAGLIFALGFIRCLYSYRKTPHRDRVEAFINRHRLQREMEELERNPDTLRRPSPWQPPPPPYIPAPPSYHGHEIGSARTIPLRPHSPTDSEASFDSLESAPTHLSSTHGRDR